MSRSKSAPGGGLKRKIAIAALGIQTVSAGFIDMDTPLDKRTTTSLIDGTVYHLVSFARAENLMLVSFEATRLLTFM